MFCFCLLSLLGLIVIFNTSGSVQTNTCSKIHTIACHMFFPALKLKVVFDSDGVQFLLTVNCGVNLYRLILSLISGTSLSLD